MSNHPVSDNIQESEIKREQLESINGKESNYEIENQYEGNVEAEKLYEQGMYDLVYSKESAETKDNELEINAADILSDLRINNGKKPTKHSLGDPRLSYRNIYTSNDCDDYEIFEQMPTKSHSVDKYDIAVVQSNSADENDFNYTNTYQENELQTKSKSVRVSYGQVYREETEEVVESFENPSKSNDMHDQTEFDQMENNQVDKEESSYSKKSARLSYRQVYREETEVIFESISNSPDANPSQNEIESNYDERSGNGMSSKSARVSYKHVYHPDMDDEVIEIQNPASHDVNHVSAEQIDHMVSILETKSHGKSVQLSYGATYEGNDNEELGEFENPVSNADTKPGPTQEHDSVRLSYRVMFQEPIKSEIEKIDLNDKNNLKMKKVNSPGPIIPSGKLSDDAISDLSEPLLSDSLQSDLLTMPVKGNDYEPPPVPLTDEGTVTTQNVTFDMNNTAPAYVHSPIHSPSSTTTSTTEKYEEPADRHSLKIRMESIEIKDSITTSGSTPKQKSCFCCFF